MSSEQPPKEYIITEEQIETIHHLFSIPEHTMDEADYMMQDEVLAAIRSRPHPAPALDELKRDLEFKQACIENQAMHINTLNAKMAEMMQGAARKASEKAFDEAIKIVLAYERKPKYDFEATLCSVIVESLNAVKEEKTNG